MLIGFPRIRIGFAFPSDDDDEDDAMMGGHGMMMRGGGGDPFGGMMGRMPDFGGAFDEMHRRMQSMMSRMNAMMGGGGEQQSMMNSMLSGMIERAQELEKGEVPEEGHGT